MEVIHDTKAYDALSEYRRGGADFMLCDIFDERTVINLLYPIIKKESREEQRGRVEQLKKQIREKRKLYERNFKKEKKNKEHKFNYAIMRDTLLEIEHWIDEVFVEGTKQ